MNARRNGLAGPVWYSLTIWCSLASWPARGVENSAAAPDLSGLWGRNSVVFEPPPSGPGPVTNIARQADGSIDRRFRVGDYANPILKPDAAKEIRRRGELSLSGVTVPTPTNQCWPQSPPMVFSNLEMQIVQQKDEITFLYMQDHLVRHIRLNAAHPAKPPPSWSGDSVGHYEGDTLVVDTIGIKAAPISLIDEYGTPHSSALHVVERYRLIDGEIANAKVERIEKTYGRSGQGSVDLAYKGKGLELEFAVEDAGVFTTPWTAFVTFRRGIPWLENVCAENRHEYYSGRDTPVPTADRPDF